MRVFSRKSGDSILVPDSELEIRILGIDGKRVTLGVLGCSGSAGKDSKQNSGDGTSAGSVPDNRIDSDISPMTNKVPHRIRNQINSVALALHALRTQVNEQSPLDHELLDHAIAELKLLDLDRIE